jgi:hypothetical protein
MLRTDAGRDIIIGAGTANVDREVCQTITISKHVQLMSYSIGRSLMRS